MRIGIQTWGSEGDIRPFVALGHALAGRGHCVELLYTEIGDRAYDDVAASLGFTARGVASPIVSAERAIDIGVQVLNTRNQLQQGLIISRELLEPVIEPMYRAAVDLCSRSDLLIHHFILHASRAAADLAGVPTVTVQFAPMLTPSRYVHPSGTPWLGRRGAQRAGFARWGAEIGNVWLWKLARFALNRTLLKDVNRLRRRVGLDPCRDLLLDAWPSHRLNLFASSPALLDRPPDWPPWHQLCGFLELPVHQGEHLAAEVDAFLSAGPPPIFMGFGSLMPIAGNVHLTETLAAFETAARLTGQRAIVQTEELRPSTDRMLYVRRTPHKLVFPRCAAVVHHAGAGTTHATLRAGVPSIPVPHVSDQFAWADELQRLGVSPAPLPRTRLNATALASRIRETLASPRMKQRAMEIRERMREDNGPETAATLIEKSCHRDTETQRQIF